MAKNNYNKYIEDKAKPLIAKAMKIAMRDFYKCARKTNNILYKDITEMYDTLITQFYKYHTTSYIRHWEGVPGTEQGQNLYFGKKFAKDNDNRISPRLIVDFSGEGMDGGYEYDTPDQVLECVMHGIRFPFGVPVANGKQYGALMVDPSEMHYKGQAFSFSNGTINDAFDKFDREFPDLSANVFYGMWGSYVKNWRAELKGG